MKKNDCLTCRSVKTRSKKNQHHLQKTIFFLRFLNPFLKQFFSRFFLFAYVLLLKLFFWLDYGRCSGNRTRFEGGEMNKDDFFCFKFFSYEFLWAPKEPLIDIRRSVRILLDTVFLKQLRIFYRNM